MSASKHTKTLPNGEGQAVEKVIFQQDIVLNGLPEPLAQK